MRCLNPGCGALDANEINISVNVSETMETEEQEYTGDTEYGDCSDLIGTVCNHGCGEVVYLSTWSDIVHRFAAQHSSELTPDEDPWSKRCATCSKLIPSTLTFCLECD